MKFTTRSKLRLRLKAQFLNILKNNMSSIYTKSMYALSPESITQSNKLQLNPSATTEVIVLTFFFLWSLIGFIAFIYSLYCFGKSGTILDKTVGFIVAVLTGPFFFLYLYVNRKYCK